MKLTSVTHKNLLSLVGVSILSVACSSNIDAKSSKDVVEETPPQEMAEKSVATKASGNTVVETLQKNLRLSGVETKIISAVPTQVNGLYWVTAEGVPPFFSDQDGKHIFQGSLIELGNGAPIDVSAKLNATVSKKELSKVAKKDMVIYPAKGKTKSVIYVFTDASCGYCQKFHQEIPAINEQGIEVRYLAWPRSPQASPMLEAVWCSDDKLKAMDLVKSGQSAPDTGSCDSPIKDQVDLGMRLGVSGTPTLFTEDGTKIGGYVPSSEIAKAIGLE